MRPFGYLAEKASLAFVAADIPVFASLANRLAGVEITLLEHGHHKCNTSVHNDTPDKLYTLDE